VLFTLTMKMQNLCVQKVTNVVLYHIKTTRITVSEGSTNLRPLFCERHLEINNMTFKLEGEQDILKMYLHTAKEAANLRHSTLRA